MPLKHHTNQIRPNLKHVKWVQNIFLNSNKLTQDRPRPPFYAYFFLSSERLSVRGHDIADPEDAVAPVDVHPEALHVLDHLEAERALDHGAVAVVHLHVPPRADQRREDLVADRASAAAVAQGQSVEKAVGWRSKEGRLSVDRAVSSSSTTVCEGEYEKFIM